MSQAGQKMKKKRAFFQVHSKTLIISTEFPVSTIEEVS